MMTGGLTARAGTISLTTRLITVNFNKFGQMVWRLSDTCGSASSGRYFIFIPRGVNNTISDTSEGTILC